MKQNKWLVFIFGHKRKGEIKIKQGRYVEIIDKLAKFVGLLFVPNICSYKLFSNYAS